MFSLVQEATELGAQELRSMRDLKAAAAAVEAAQAVEKEEEQAAEAAKAVAEAKREAEKKAKAAAAKKAARPPPNPAWCASQFPQLDDHFVSPRKCSGGRIDLKVFCLSQGAAGGRGGVRAIHGRLRHGIRDG